MDNEKFQTLVLEHFVKLSQEISEFKTESNQKMDKIESKVDCAINEIASLREDISGLQNEKFEIKRVK